MKYCLENESGRNSWGQIITTAFDKDVKMKWSRRTLDDKLVNDDETKSQQCTLFHEEMGFLRKTFSFQVGKTKDLVKLDPETNAMIKLRYKDTSKYIIWPDCALPEEYSQGYMVLNSDRSKRTAIRYSHAGNHQPAVLKLKNNEASKKDSAVVSHVLSKSLPGTKSLNNRHQEQHQPYYTIYPAHTLPSKGMRTVEEEALLKRAISLEPRTTNGSGKLVDIDDDRTPFLKRVINSVRRSESSDEDEPIVSLTSSQSRNKPSLDEIETSSGDSEEPDLRVWRL